MDRVVSGPSYTRTTAFLGFDEPRLNNGDSRDRKKFRLTYIKYVIEHENVMCQRVLKRAVIEHIKPSLLSGGQSFLRVHKCRARLGYEENRIKISLERQDPEGISKLKSIKITLTGEGAERNVQKLVRQFQNAHDLGMEMKVEAEASNSKKPGGSLNHQKPTAYNRLTTIM